MCVSVRELREKKIALCAVLMYNIKVRSLACAVSSGGNFITGCSAVGSAGGLGPSGRGFEPLHSDQKLSEISDFREFFLFFVYCGARTDDF